MGMMITCHGIVMCIITPGIMCTKTWVYINHGVHYTQQNMVLLFLPQRPHSVEWEQAGCWGLGWGGSEECRSLGSENV